MRPAATIFPPTAAPPTAAAAAADPSVALVHRGVAALADGQAAIAASCFAAAAVLTPHRPSIWHNQGEALRALGQPLMAQRAFGRALRLRPAYPKALAGLAELLRATRRPKAAARALSRALALDPGFAVGWTILAPLLRERRAMERLRVVLRRVVILDPTGADAWIALARCVNELESSSVAAVILQRALALNPASPVGQGGHAGLLVRQGDLDGARAIHARLRRLVPLDGQADAGDSLLATMRGDFARGRALACRSLALQPAGAAALISLALAEHDLGGAERAQRSNARAMALDPDGDVARFNQSMVLLAQGDFAEGWRMYEARWRMERTPFPAYAPPWPGGDPAGRSLLLVAEQGQGDTLQFVRYAPMLAACGARVHLLVPPSLVRLFSGMPGLASVRSFDDPPPACDACMPLMSLPLMFGTTLATVPATVPYLQAAEPDRRHWHARLAGEARLKVGLVWAGAAHEDQIVASMTNRRRSLALAAFAPLAEVPGVAFYSLQKGPPADQAKAPPAGLELIDWMDAVRDFADTAAFVEQLDLVISVDTSVCHLAGALARPVWVLSRFDACWRWLRDRDDSPWYPTLRLFRQGTPGDWVPVVARVRAALAEWASSGA